MNRIRIGTMTNEAKALKFIPNIIDYRFESFAVSFSAPRSEQEMKEFAKKLFGTLEGHDAVISVISTYGNPLADPNCAETWKCLIDNAHLFGTDVVTGFAGRVPGESIDRSIPRFKEVFGELAKRAEDKGVRLAFENCNMGGTWQSGDWNIAHGPIAWEMMFDAVPSKNLGLEWEPCHQMVALVDPIPQLRKWVGRIYHIHGKDATVAWDVIREYGIYSPKPFAWHRTPGFGDSNWADILTILQQGRYTGTIDIEGYHDPVYNGELEMTGQLHALNYLKRCRGGEFVPNPEGIF
jgi:sugar phosphate isomerase/epimerase